MSVFSFVAEIGESYRDEGWVEGISKGFAQGLGFGRREAKLKTARLLHEKGMTDNEIIRFIDLKIDDIRAVSGD